MDVVVDVQVIDNQFAKQGDVLFVIDPIGFGLAVQSALIGVDDTRDQVAALEETKRESERATVFAKDGAGFVAKAQSKSAAVQGAVAELKLSWTEARAPTSGYVTNLGVDEGDFALHGLPMVALWRADHSTFRASSARRS